MSAVDQAFIRAYAHDAASPTSLKLPGETTSAERSPYRTTGASRVGAATSHTATLRIDPAAQRSATSRSAAAPDVQIAAPAQYVRRNADEPWELIERRETSDLGRTDEIERAAAPGSVDVDRRPLSAWSPRTSVVATFQPAVEVDTYIYSETCERLVTSFAPSWHGAIDAALGAVDRGQSMLGVTGVAPGSGCTTTVICLGRLLARQGLRIAWVDGDFHSPQLARELGLAVEAGWEQVLDGRTPLAECAVASLDEPIVLLPLLQGGAAASSKIDNVQASVAASVLRYHFDVVLFDLGALSVASQADAASRMARQCRIDGVVVVGEGPALSSGGLWQLQRTAPQLGEAYLGDIVNFSTHMRQT